MDFLPKELWLEIFEFVDARDLLSLSETCKIFNEIVFKTKLVEKLTLNLREKLVWESGGERKYSQVKITGCNEINANALKNIGKFLRRIWFEKCRATLKNLTELLSEFENLKFVKFSEFKIEVDNIENLNFPSFKNITIYFEDSSPQIFEIFSKSTAIEVIVDNKCSAQHVDFTALKNFLRSQKNLESLGLLYFSINTNLFTDNSLDFVQFRLKKFAMNGVYFGTESVGKFMTFMLNHVNSLQTLHIQSPFMDISFFTQFSTLKNLEISHTNAFFDSFIAIEKLTVENVSGNWMQKFPNVRELKMIFKYGVFLGMYADLVKLLDLRKLTIIDSKIPELNIPSVRELNLINVTLCAKKPFRYEENQIRQLTIESCNASEWIADYLAQERSRLERLSICNTRLIDLTRKLIEGHQGGKIKQLRIVNC